MTKISKTHYITKNRVVKRNPRKSVNKLKYVGYIGEKINSLKVDDYFKKKYRNRKIKDVVYYKMGWISKGKPLVSPFFVLDDGDVVSVKILKHNEKKNNYNP